MKKILLVLVLFFSFSGFSQTEDEEAAIREVIETFFEGFHSRDSMLMKSVVNDRVVMQSISRNSKGEVTLQHEDFGRFLRSVTAIPLNTSFREELHSYTISRDGVMAHVWTPYSLFVNEEFRHCGVNSFQLFKKEGNWRIICLADTRRRQGCDERKLE